jgi:hypothetical protein
MPAFANIVLADSVPANNTFAPVRLEGSTAMHEDRNATTSAGFKTLFLELNRASGSRSTNRIKMRLNIPYEATADGVTTVRSIARHVGENILPDDMTALERNNFATLVAAAYAHATIKGYTKDLDVEY